MKYLKIIVNNNSIHTDDFYTYKVEGYLESEIKIGHRVLVTFGKSNKPIEGYVFDIVNEYECSFVIKNIVDILDKEPLLSHDDIKLIEFMRDEYICTYMDVINLLYPKGIRVRNDRIVILKDKGQRLGKIQAQVVDVILKNNNQIKLSDLRKKMKVSSATLSTLKEKNIIDIIWSYEALENEKKYKCVSINKDDIDNVDLVIANISKKAPIQAKILSILKENGEVAIMDLIDMFGVNRASINSLLEKGFINEYEYTSYRTPKTLYEHDKNSIELNDEQQCAVNILNNNLYEDTKKIYMLYGITGSGKTQVYIKTIEKALAMGKSSIVLVPEISLTPQTIAIFKNYFSHSDVAVLHSRLSEGEKHDEYMRIKNNQAKIVIGARSALFAPCNDLGVIILDEFHESSYKSDKSPKYNTVEVAKYISKQKNAMLILGSATPSIEEYYKESEHEKIFIRSRANKKPLPKIDLVDMKEELDFGNKSIFSRKLQYAINEAIDNGNQVILFLNRRGYANFISCRKCAYTFTCENCDISLTYHKHTNTGVCHYCGYEMIIPKECPSCKSTYIKQFGIGTQRVEEETRRCFKDVGILRVDKDTTSKKGSLEKILSDFKDKKAHILIGTQMISKGLDFPNVSLVGILSADMMLKFPDFKSSEATFQMINQVAGRAGRADISGKVILQAYETEHYAVQYAKEYDFENFYNDEIKIRKLFAYAPFNNLISVTLSSDDENKVIKNAKILRESIEYMLMKKGYKDFEFILGPNPCPISKINSKHRWQVLLKDLSVEISLLKGIIKYICIQKKEFIFDKDVLISIDVNPLNIL